MNAPCRSTLRLDAVPACPALLPQWAGEAVAAASHAMFGFSDGQDLRVTAGYRVRFTQHALTAKVGGRGLAGQVWRAGWRRSGCIQIGGAAQEDLPLQMTYTARACSPRPPAVPAGAVPAGAGEQLGRAGHAQAGQPVGVAHHLRPLREAAASAAAALHSCTAMGDAEAPCLDRSGRLGACAAPVFQLQDFFDLP